MSSQYGICPVCGADGVSRERRPNGNDTCANGCTYPSQDALPPNEPRESWAQAAQRVGEELADVGPRDYYNMTPNEWRRWATAEIHKLQRIERGRE